MKNTEANYKHIQYRLQCIVYMIKKIPTRQLFWQNALFSSFSACLYVCKKLKENSGQKLM